VRIDGRLSKAYWVNPARDGCDFTVYFMCKNSPYWRRHLKRIIEMQIDAGAAGMPFQSYLAAAIGIWLGLQSFVNIGVNMGLLPTKGLTLPLLSYGGSSMLVTLGWLGVLLRINHETQTAGRPATGAREGRRT
jgi:hypothetical protein